MRRLLLFLTFQLLTFSAFANFTAQWFFTDYTDNPMGIKQVYVTALWNVTASGTNAAIGSQRALRQTTAGVLTISNMIAGGYRLEFVGTTFTNCFTNVFGTNVSGLVNGLDYISSTLAVNGTTTAYSQNQSDARFMAKTNGSANNPTFTGTVKLPGSTNLGYVWTQTNNGSGTWSPASSGGGETNTSSNLGTGEGIAATKSGVDLPFKSLKAGGGNSISSDATSITITGVTTNNLAPTNAPTIYNPTLRGRTDLVGTNGGSPLRIEVVDGGPLHGGNYDVWITDPALFGYLRHSINGDWQVNDFTVAGVTETGELQIDGGGNNSIPVILFNGSGGLAPPYISSDGATTITNFGNLEIIGETHIHDGDAQLDIDASGVVISYTNAPQTFAQILPDSINLQVRQGLGPVSQIQLDEYGRAWLATDSGGFVAADTNGSAYLLNTSKLNLISATSNGDNFISAADGRTNYLTGRTVAGPLSISNSVVLLNVTGSRMAVFDASKNLTNSTIDSSYVDPTSSIQTQLNSKQALGAVTNLETRNLNFIGSLAVNGLTSTNAIIYGDGNHTNAVVVNASGETLSNAVGSVTIAGGVVSASGLLTANGVTDTNTSSHIIYTNAVDGYSEFWDATAHAIVFTNALLAPFPFKKEFTNGMTQWGTNGVSVSTNNPITGNVSWAKGNFSINGAGSFSAANDSTVSGQLTVGANQNLVLGTTIIHQSTLGNGSLSIAGSTQTATPIIQNVFFGNSGARNVTNYSGTNALIQIQAGTIPIIRIMSANSNVLDMIVSDVLTPTNGVMLPQLSAIPTNSIPANSTTASVTNWFRINLNGYPYDVATNLSGGGWLYIKAAAITLTP